ncbi:thiamine pyrophosphate-binding protein [Clostridium botulinum]|uniref:thiamine pyrophosphate-binding protein n=1 Tax=Clostridium botulinum TaxID=1491 RepID=UPI00077310BF|nr:thiamine pyrophosphate-binding protein [Clostridium botulinum]MBY6809968.1 thiamine pyrophosphate-binding protein [Clostridium botulinum]MBY6823624.1 thiamine pyrophosphate-binding protein [Clostridium botulinum]MBY6834235.1 thiamine pyrophosphate-binding protein [Clostridium botulinum]MBY6972582.1 thiamine pyrophosphate-binding protein [Clostridium botulinum]MCS6103198.1 thiamine pyrophosphate-binding protein [Clostridium botulinum]
MKLSKAIAKYIESCGVEYVFGIPSGNVASIYDALNDTKVEFVVTKNEAGSTYSAGKYSDLSKKLSCSILCGGVGITNAINGIADAYINNIPMLVISGYAASDSIGKGCVQELDTAPITESITKYSKTITKKEDVLSELDKAVKLAMQDPKGPVHLSISMDLPTTEISEEDIKTYVAEKIDYNYDQESLNVAINMLNDAKKGIILVGRGAKGNNELIKKLSSKLGWYVATTPQGKSSIDSEFEFNIGNYGFNSTDFAQNYADTEEIDCVLVLGSSLGESATRNFSDALFNDGNKVIQIDNKKKSLNKNHIDRFKVYYELSEALAIIDEKVEDKNVTLNKVEKLNNDYVKDHTGISVRKLADMLPNILNPSTTYMCDIGEFMNYMYKYLFIPKESDFIASLNYGAMGNCVAGSIGAALSGNTEKYAVVVGDGSVFMNGSEILTAKQYSLPIVYFVINNAKLNYVDQGMTFLFGRSINGVVQDRVSIKAIGEGAGIKSYEITDLSQLNEIKDELYSCNEPIIVEIITDGSEKVAAADRFKTLKNKK